MRGERDGDRDQHGLRVVQHLVVPESQDIEACVQQIARTRSIIFYLFQVLASVQLDHQPGLQAEKVREVRSNPVLTAEFPSQQATVPQPPPECPFSFSLFATQVAFALVIQGTAHEVISGWTETASGVRVVDGIGEVSGRG